MTDFEKFKENAEREPVPIKVELNLISKLFEVIESNDLIPDFNLNARVKAFEEAAEQYLLNREE